MELRDLIVTPIVIFLVYAGAYWIRPYLTDSVNKKYFIPALTVRIIGALAVGFIYQFYYDGGDTFAYHSFGSRIIWEAFVDSPAVGIKLLFADGEYESSIFKYASKIWYFRDQQSYFLIRVAAILDFFTFSTYSATAVLFAVIGFSGSWMLFKTFYKMHPDFHRWMAGACLFIPTVCFWGSGIFKDTLTLAALGFITFALYKVAFEKRRMVLFGLIAVIGMWVIYSMKKYILISFLPALIIWIAYSNLTKIRSVAARLMIVPVLAVIVIGLGYYSAIKVGEDDARYNMNQLAMTAKITAYDIRYGWGARTGEGSGYTLGELDGTWQSLLSLAPAAINVSLFRPYVWEVLNPFMLLSSLEGLAFLIISLYLVFRIKSKFFVYARKPEVLFCLTFAIIFAFAVGVSTYNFGTLSRYKIPMEPFYLMGVGLIFFYSKNERKFTEFESTE